jgi:hypothetical protein
LDKNIELKVKEGYKVSSGATILGNLKNKE